MKVKPMIRQEKTLKTTPDELGTDIRFGGTFAKEWPLNIFFSVQGILAPAISRSVSALPG
jgi:hypothetical protein